MKSTARGQPLHDLPAQLSTFVGQDVELAELRRLLRKGRLLTLKGADGSGKTRLALKAVDHGLT